MKKPLQLLLKENRIRNREIVKAFPTEASMSVGIYNSRTKKGPSSWPSGKPRATAMLRYGVYE
jgi:hypothetical protein